MSIEDELERPVPIIDVSCDAERLCVSLEDGPMISVPLRWYPRLAQATPARRARWEPCGIGSGIHWPEIDEDLSVTGLRLGRAAPGIRT